MTVEHKIYTYDPDDSDRVYWECSCGTGGSCPYGKEDLHSDKHIRYDLGEGRTDISKPFE